MDTITNGQIVEANYTLTNNAGDVIDTSTGKAPLTYIQGVGGIIPGLEKEMMGKKVGDKFKVTIEPDHAYGFRDEGLIQSVPKSQFGLDIEEIKVGTQFQVATEQGHELIVTATEVKEDEVVLDGNHPLAGETLHFEIEILSVREATPEDLSPEESSTDE